MMYETDQWTEETREVLNLLDRNDTLRSHCETLSHDELRETVLEYLSAGASDTFIGPEDHAFIEWDEIMAYHDWPVNVIDFPERTKTVEEIAADVVAQGLSTAESVARVVEAHADAIELVVGILEQQEEKIERLSKQMRTMIEVHGT